MMTTTKRPVVRFFAVSSGFIAGQRVIPHNAASLIDTEAARHLLLPLKMLRSLFKC
jgi:hypothetical protein